MESQKRLSLKREQKALIRQPGFDSKIYFGLSENAVSRFSKAERTNKFHDLLCDECKCLVKLSDFDGKTIRISIPVTEEEDELYLWRVQQFIVGLKEKEEEAGRPLKGQYSNWKKKAAKRIFGKCDRTTARYIERLVKRVDAYTPKERLEVGAQDALTAYLDKNSDQIYKEEKTKNKCTDKVFTDLTSWQSAHKWETVGKDRNGKLFQCNKCGEEWFDLS